MHAVGPPDHLRPGAFGGQRFAGLPRKMALLVASGNSICGNSAIAAVARVIGAKPSDVASAMSRKRRSLRRSSAAAGSMRDSSTAIAPPRCCR